MNHPYIETKISQDTFIRQFSQNTDSSEMLWHRDKEDRIIESLEETDWMFQLDNQLPQKISGEILFENQNLLQIDEKSLQKIRGKKIGFILCLGEFPKKLFISIL